MKDFQNPLLTNWKSLTVAEDSLTVPMSMMLRNKWSDHYGFLELVLKLPEQVPIVNFLTEAEIMPVLVLKNL